MNKKLEKKFEKIVEEATSGQVTTLQRRNSDSLDFHDVSVGTLTEIMRMAYLVGKHEQKLKMTKEYGLD